MKLMFWNYTFIYLLLLYFPHQTVELHEGTGCVYLFDLHVYETEQMAQGCPTRGLCAVQEGYECGPTRNRKFT